MSRRPKRPPETVDIVDLTHDGRGVARTDGKTLFVDGALPGETVEAVRLRKRKTHDEGKVLNLLVSAAERVEPACPWFQICGGCSLQHLDGSAQLAAKEKVLLDNLLRIGGVEPRKIYPPIHGPALGYRRRARLGVRWVEGKGRALVGFRERFSSFIADIEYCPVLAPPADDLIQPLSRLVSGLSLKKRLPQIEVSIGDNRTALVFRILEDPTDRDLDSLRQFRIAHGVDVYLQRGGVDTIAALDGVAAPLVYHLPEFGLEYRFLPTDFIQINAAINRQMVSRVTELLGLEPAWRVLDLFSGLGNFSLPMARRTATVTALEGDESLVARARENAGLNGIDSAEFHVANLFEECRDLPWAAGPYDAVLLDPPRSGARQILPVVDGARRIAYVSCHPGTLARDAGILVGDYGYRLEGAGVIDMFPNTAHVESMALFIRD
mgnify:CR=1 FL=1